MKILYISDSTLAEYNSVRDILYNIVTSNELSEYEHVIVKATGRIFDMTKIEYQGNLKIISISNSGILKLCKDRSINVCARIRCVIQRLIYKLLKKVKKADKYVIKQNVKYIRKQIENECPQIVVFLTYSPEKEYANICIQNHIPYVSVLYDTYIDRPKNDFMSAYKIESAVIEHSQGYFVPDFFFEKYKEIYDNPKVISMKLPLVVPRKQIMDSYQQRKAEYEFSYFGRIQSFRNGEEIKKILREVNIKLDVFTTQNYTSDDVFNIHPAKTGNELFGIVAKSKFLVAFDNSHPYEHYLPSKAYLYVSFTKPVIVFGDNEKSALKTFFEEYPYFYYQNINESTDGLKGFLKKQMASGFDEVEYNKYNGYLPENALIPLVSKIKEVLKNENLMN